MITLQAVSTGSYLDAETGQMEPTNPTPIMDRIINRTLRTEAVSSTNPPPPRREAIPAPRPGCTWIPGYWAWSSSAQTWGWASGQWKCQAAAAYTPPGTTIATQTQTGISIKADRSQGILPDGQVTQFIQEGQGVYPSQPGPASWVRNNWKLLLGVGAGVAAIGGGAYYFTRSR